MATRKPLSEEHKRKISEALKGRHRGGGSAPPRMPSGGGRHLADLARTQDHRAHSRALRQQDDREMFGGLSGHEKRALHAHHTGGNGAGLAEGAHDPTVVAGLVKKGLLKRRNGQVSTTAKGGRAYQHTRKG